MLNAIRGFLFYVAFSIILIPFAITLWMLKPFKRDWRFAYARKWANLMLWLGRVICGMRWEEKGMENLPDSSQPVVVLAKHQSAWETFWMFARLPNYISYVYKKELHWVPVFGWALASMGMMAINRAEGRHAFVQFMRQGAKFMDDGWWIVLFPEGTRTTPGCEPNYKTGGARFAVSKGVPVVPIALNAGELWPRNSIAKKPGLITVSVGPMIETKGKTVEEVQQAMINWIEGEMAVISPEIYGQKKA